MSSLRALLATLLLPGLALTGCKAAPQQGTGTSSSGGSSTGGSSSGGTTGGLLTGTLLPSGQAITPTAAPGSVFQPLNPGLADFPAFTAGQAVSTVVSPDGKTLLILTSGFNLMSAGNGSNLPQDSNEYVFVYDISGPAPVQSQVLQVSNTYLGIAFAPDGAYFYVGGGIDDSIHEFVHDGAGWSEHLGTGGGPLVRLGHVCGNTFVTPTSPVQNADQVCAGFAPPGTAGLAVTADGNRLVVANHTSDSISIVDLSTATVTADLDLRPGKSNASQQGVPGGEYPFDVAIVGNATAYVSSVRDREIVVVNLAGAPAVTRRIAVPGNPGRMILNKSQTKLFVACDNSDRVAIVDTSSNAILEAISTGAPPGVFPTGDAYPGSAPNGLALSPDEQTLYVTNGGTNSVGVIALPPTGSHEMKGLIPTGWYPHSVSVGNDGGVLYVVNGKSIAGPNPCNADIRSDCADQNQFVLQLEKAGFLTLPVPSAPELTQLTAQVAANNGFSAAPNAGDEQLFAQLRGHIKHVIYILKENRTYDQILGDLPAGNGDPALAMYPQPTTPNQHALAANFVTLDDYYVSGEVSFNGWPWSTSARESDLGVKTVPVTYAGRGYTTDGVGQNRSVNVGIGDPGERIASDPILTFNPDPDLLPGIGNSQAPDAPANAVNGSDGGYQQGYLWDSALRAGLTVRNYGFFVDELRYAQTPWQIPLYLDPYATDGGTVVAYASNPTLAGLTDPYFRGFDSSFPDFYREKEWEREFDGYVDGGTLPNLELVRLAHDHMGSFSTAISGVNTPELQQADNDYAVGKLIAKVAASPYANSTLIFITEDDAQAGPDHVDAHRSIALIAGPYVKQGQVVATHYTTVNLLRTMEDVLGIGHLNVNDAYQRPMSDVFDLSQATWSFTATPSALLKANTTLPIAMRGLDRPHLRPTHRAAYWAALTRDIDFSTEDNLDAAEYNRILWRGLMGSRPYPTERSGADLRLNRPQLLRHRSGRSSSAPRSRSVERR